MLDIAKPPVSTSGINDDSNSSDHEIESSFSLLNDFTGDDFSLLSFCDDNLGDIELVPTVRCYTHSRNVKLNKFLDFLVVLSLATVVGLGIGNFIGHSTNCTHPSPLINSLQYTAKLDPVTPGFVPKLDNNHVRKNELSLHSKECSITNETENVMDIIVNTNLDNVINKAENSIVSYRETFHGAAESISSQDILGEPTDNNISLMPFYDLKFNVAVKKNLKDFSEVHFETSEESSYFDLITILNIGIDDIVHKVQNLVSVIINENKNSNEIKTVENMFEIFLKSVKGKTAELNNFTAVSLFPSSERGRKHFMKMSHLIIKSVDQLLANRFIEILIKSKKPLKLRLKSICDIGFNVIKDLEKKWSGQKKKLLYHKDNYVSAENPKYKKERGKGRKMNFDVGSSSDYKSKQNYPKIYVKSKKQYFPKKKY